MARASTGLAQALSGRLVFEGRCLIRGDGQVYHAFSDPSEGGDDWDRTVALLGADYPALTANRSPPSLPEGEIAGPCGRALVISQDTTETSLTLGHATPGATVRVPVEPDRMPDAIADGIPFPIWLRGADGTIEWVNSVYLDLAARPGAGATTRGHRAISSSPTHFRTPQPTTRAGACPF